MVGHGRAVMVWRTGFVAPHWRVRVIDVWLVGPGCRLREAQQAIAAGVEGRAARGAPLYLEHADLDEFVGMTGDVARQDSRNLSEKRSVDRLRLVHRDAGAVEDCQDRVEQVAGAKPDASYRQLALHGCGEAPREAVAV